MRMHLRWARVLMTGGAGFIRSSVAGRFIKDGNKTAAPKGVEKQEHINLSRF